MMSAQAKVVKLMGLALNQKILGGLLHFQTLSAAVIISNVFCGKRDSICKPKVDDEIVNNWYAISFMGEKVPHLFNGRLTRRCRVGRVHAIECVCLKEKVGSGDLLIENETREKDIVALEDILMGPLECSYEGRCKWNVKKYSDVKKFFEMTKNYERVNSRQLYFHRE